MMGITFSFEVVLLGDYYPETQTINHKYQININTIGNANKVFLNNCIIFLYFSKL